MALQVAQVESGQAARRKECRHRGEIVAHDITQMIRIVERFESVRFLVHRNAIFPVRLVRPPCRFPVDVDIASIHGASLSSAAFRRGAISDNAHYVSSHKPRDPAIFDLGGLRRAASRGGYQQDEHKLAERYGDRVELGATVRIATTRDLDAPVMSAGGLPLTPTIAQRDVTVPTVFAVAGGYTCSPGTAPELVNEQVVIDERVTTAAGVASGMDLAIKIAAISKDLPPRSGSRRGDHTVAL